MKVSKSKCRPTVVSCLRFFPSTLGASKNFSKSNNPISPFWTCSYSFFRPQTVSFDELTQVSTIWLNHAHRITNALLTHNEKLFFFWCNIVYDVFSYGTVKKACFLHNDVENPLIKKATLTDSLSCQIYPYLLLARL